MDIDFNYIIVFISIMYIIWYLWGLYKFVVKLYGWLEIKRCGCGVVVIIDDWCSFVWIRFVKYGGMFGRKWLVKVKFWIIVRLRVSIV